MIPTVLGWGFCRLHGRPVHRMVGSDVVVAQRPVPVGVAMAYLLPVQAPLRWDVLVDGFAAILAEHPELVASAATGRR